MATNYQIESGGCTGRGFASTQVDGFLAKFKLWIVKLPSAGGPGWFIFDSSHENDGTNPYIVVCDVAAPSPNDMDTGPSGQPPKFIKIGYITSESNFIRVWYGFWWNTGTATLYGHWGGLKVATYDSTPFLYDFRGGAECLAVSSLTSSVTAAIVDEFEAAPGLLEDTSVITKLAAPASLGTNVVLSVLDATPFIPMLNKWVYITNFNNAHRVEYVQITSVDDVLNTITVDSISDAFPAGAIIGAYPHRIYNCGTTPEYTPGLNQNGSKFPYCSYPHNFTRCFTSLGGYISGTNCLCQLRETLQTINPDDYGYYSMQKPLLGEYYREGNASTTEDMNRIYGNGKNIIVARNNSYVTFQDGLIDIASGKEYIVLAIANAFFAIGLDSNYRALILNTTSLT